MNWNQAIVAIQTAFRNGWGSTTPVAWSNVTYDARVGVDFVRFTVLKGGSDQASMASVGSRTFRHYGLATIQVFVAPQTGEKVAIERAEVAGAIFRGKTISGIVFRAPELIDIGVRGGFYQLNVNIPFHFDGFY